MASEDNKEAFPLFFIVGKHTQKTLNQSKILQKNTSRSAHE